MDRKRVGRLLTFFQVELFVFFFILSVAVDDVTVTLMAQEKICMSRFNATRLCANLSKLEQLPEFEEKNEFVRQKDIILAEVTHFGFFQQMISTLPVIFTSIFISSWADKHPNSSKILLTLSSLMSICESLTMFICSVYFHSGKFFVFLLAFFSIITLLETNANTFILITSDVYLMLFASIFFPLAGGNQGFIMAVMSYLSSTTKASSRVKRFSLLEFTFILAFPIGVFLGGQIVNSPNLTEFARSNGALHNYHQVFLLSIIGKIISLIYVVVMPFKSQRDDCKSPEGSFCDTSSEGSFKTAVSRCDDAKFETLESSPLLHGQALFDDSGIHEQRLKARSVSACHEAPSSMSFSSLFSWQNVLESFDVAFRRRPNGAHIQIWLLIATMSVYVMVARSINVILFQFVQKLYYWDAGYYSTINSLFFVTTHLFGLLVIIPLLRKVLKTNDITLLLFGLLSYMAQNFIRGAIKSENWFYVTYAIGSITPVIAIASRSQLAKLAPVNELNRIFGVLALLETLTPFLGTAIFTQIFAQTITYFPGAAHITSSLILVLPFLFTAFLGLYEANRIRRTKISTKDRNNNPDSVSQISTTSFDESLQTVIFVEK